ncbi:hypothetical protein M0654_07650 [Rhizobium sp. NTR19]|uniref:Uncharacterized protein n=1 Tax=Neorhizobium turbinariae TaxID=2937795 RepID=A0ABT0IPR2_9HYPH|nr:hypothetical protein [Neorhizobium turbinariae]MCK8779861.1 hypothetical protein [Neorhizobium turbinariae]
MLFELFAALISGIAVAGIAMSLRWMSHGRLPKWIVPAGAGISMLAFAIWSEYSWFDRVSGTLPNNAVVVWKNESRSPLRPWSYLSPVVTRFSAVDQATAQRHENFPDHVMIDVMLMARWEQPARIKIAFDCERHQRADLVGSSISIAQDGSIVGAKWIDVAEDDPVLVASCKRS